MPTPNIIPELEKLIATIASKPTYSGATISASVMRQLVIEAREDGAGILAPAWFPVLENGRGARKSTTQSFLWRRMYDWMAKRNMFHSTTERGRINEAKAMTWYINKYGNEQFRRKVYVDIYTRAREQCVRDVEKKYSELESSITHQIL